METGELVHWVSRGAYGFIRPDAGGKDIFLHAANIMPGELIHVGSRVQFEVRKDERRGLQAMTARALP
ncbi:MAG: cold-shock protein [Luteimonas sp.]